MTERSKLSSRPSSVGVRMEKFKFNTQRIERATRKKCCGR